jgi:hypothetical protein
MILESGIQETGKNLSRPHGSKGTVSWNPDPDLQHCIIATGVSEENIIVSIIIVASGIKVINWG